MIASLLTTDDPEEVAYDLDLSVDAVHVAAAFEDLLRDEAGLPV